jgi:hypothetical protein
MQSENDEAAPTELGVKQAMYILHCIHEGRGEKEIVSRFDGNERLVATWIVFLRDRGWIVKHENEWLITAKGAEQLIYYYRI